MKRETRNNRRGQRKTYAAGLGKIEVERDAKVAWVILNRPHVLNCLTRELLRDLVSVLEGLGRDSEVRVVILRGAGNVFSSGEDLRAAAELTSTEFRDLVRLFQTVTRVLLGMPQATIAAIDGHAVGGALEFALACDLRVATHRARFLFPEVNIGQVMTNATSILLPRVVGDGWTRELILTGESVDATTAQAIGLVTRVVAAERLDLEVRSLATRLATRAPSSIRLSKQVLNRVSSRDVDLALWEEEQAVLEAFSTPEASEGLVAFLEKREAHFG